jgi:glycine hydroxymethyltransferase
MVLCDSEFSENVDKGCPLVIGGPLPHMVAAKAVAFTEALQPAFASYAKNIVDNSKAMADACTSEGLTVATGGTDNHLFLVDVRPLGLTGRQAESVMRECGITLNRNSLPFDPNGPWYTSGLRLGTAAVTSLGMGKGEMAEMASIVADVLKNTTAATVESGKNAGQVSKAKYNIDPEVAKKARERVEALLGKFVLYPELDLEFLRRNFG